MVAADEERDDAGLGDRRGGALDVLVRAGEIEAAAERHVADVGDLRVRAVGMVFRT